MSEIQLLQQARAAIQAGKKAESERLLRQVISINPRSEVAWLWLSAVVSDPAQESECLERVLEINPNNEIAQKHWLRAQAQVIPPEIAQTAPSFSPTSQATPSVPASSASQPNTISMIMIALLALLGLFWMGDGLLQMSIDLATPKAGLKPICDGVEKLFVAGCFFWGISEILKRYKRIVVGLIFLAAAGSLLSLIQLMMSGVWRQVIAIPLYIALGILAHINREQFTELTPKELEKKAASVQQNTSSY